MSVLSQNPGKLTAREGWRSGKEAAAPQGYLSESPSFINLFIVLLTWPTLLQVVFNQKLRSRKDALSVNTLKKYRNTQFVWRCKKTKSHTVVTENKSQLAGEKMLREGRNYKMENKIFLST